jgi:hypothetical protein
VLSSDHSVGLEHTLAIVQGIKDGERPTERFQDELQTALEATGFNVGVVTRIPQSLGTQLADRTIRKREVDAVIDMVREAVAIGGNVSFEEMRDILGDDGTIVWSDPKRLRKKRKFLDLKEGLVAVAAVGVSPSSSPFVMRSLSGGVYGRNLLQATSDEKADKIDLYRRNHNEVWLLVVGSEYGGPLDIAVADDEFVSPFEKTLLLELYQGRAAIPRTRPPELDE